MTNNTVIEYLVPLFLLFGGLFVMVRAQESSSSHRPHRLRVGSQPPPTPTHLQTLEGTQIPLVDEQKPTILCFLRHLA